MTHAWATRSAGPGSPFASSRHCYLGSEALCTSLLRSIRRGGTSPLGRSGSRARRVDEGYGGRLAPAERRDVRCCPPGARRAGERVRRRHGRAGATSSSFDPPLVKYSNSLLSFTHPADWKAYPFQWAGELHFQPLVYLSTQAVHDPCSTKGNTTSCGFPVKQLEPGGVLVTWNASNPPSTGFGPGPRIQVDGHPATRTITAGGMCSSIGADRTVDVLIQTHPSPPRRRRRPRAFAARAWRRRRRASTRCLHPRSSSRSSPALRRRSWSN